MNAPGSGRTARGAGRAAVAALGAAFALTGAAGLMLQVVWQRELALLFGNTIEATGAVLAAFLGSLALGSGWLGGRLDRGRRSLSAYGALEIATGLGALASLLLVRPVGAAGVAAFRALGGDGPALTAVRCLLAFVLIAPATVPMGATLPALAAWAVERGAGARRLGLLYGLNTLGAAAGALTAAFVAILALGIRGTWVMAALVDLGIGLVVLLAARREADSRPETTGPRAAEPEGSGPVAAPPPRGALILAAGSGAVLLGLEVLWTRALVLHFGSHVASFALVLATVLLGLAVGALLAAHIAPRTADPLAWAGVAAALAAIAGAWGVRALRGLSDLMASLAGALGVSGYWGTIALEALAAFQVVLLPAALGGMIFPLLLGGVRRGARPARAAGRLVAASSAGTLAGSLGTALVLVPALGVGRAFGALLGLEATVGAALLVARRPAAGAGLALASLAATGGLLASAGPLESILMSAGVFADGATKVLHREDGRHGLLTVEERGAAGEGARRWRSISVNGVNVAGTTPDLLATQKLQAHLPLLLATRPRRVLHIGVGSGGTARSALLHPLERLDIVELNPRIPAISDRWFREVNGGVLFADARLRIHYGDGRTWLLSTSERYDAILSDSIHPRYAGNGALYTADYYRICRDRLAPGGVVSQWLPLYSLPPEAYRMIVRAFLTVFPDAILWYPHRTLSANSILIGSRDGFDFSAAGFSRAFADPALAADLAEIGIDGPRALLSCYLAGPAGLARLAGDVAPHTDDRPTIEYAAGRVHGERMATYRDWTWARNLELLARVRESGAVPPEESAAVGRKLEAFVRTLDAATP